MILEMPILLKLLLVSICCQSLNSFSFVYLLISNQLDEQGSVVPGYDHVPANYNLDAARNNAVSNILCCIFLRMYHLTIVVIFFVSLFINQSMANLLEVCRLLQQPIMEQFQQCRHLQVIFIIFF